MSPPGISPARLEYSRRPGIFPMGPRIRGSRERSWSPAGIFQAGRGYPRVARGHYHGLAALKEAARASPVNYFSLKKQSIVMHGF